MTSNNNETASSDAQDESAETKSYDSLSVTESATPPEVSSEQPRGLGKILRKHIRLKQNNDQNQSLGLLGNRRRLPLRRPGQVL